MSNSQSAHLIIKVERSQVNEVVEIGCDLDKSLRSMEGFITLRLDDMCLVPNLVMPQKFKVPNIEKYKGVSCPRHHLVMFYQKMTSYTHDNKLIIHYFLDSLSGTSLSWYVKLESTHIQSWEDLANSFLKHYKYNLDMAPD